MNFVWLLGFEPRSPRPQRGFLTTKLQPQHIHNNKYIIFIKFQSLLMLERRTVGYTVELYQQQLPELALLSLKTLQTCAKTLKFGRCEILLVGFGMLQRPMSEICFDLTPN